jgi:hypothetical protein
MDWQNRVDEADLVRFKPLTTTDETLATMLLKTYELSELPLKDALPTNLSSVIPSYLFVSSHQPQIKYNENLSWCTFMMSVWIGRGEQTILVLLYRWRGIRIKCYIAQNLMASTKAHKDVYFFEDSYISLDDDADPLSRRFLITFKVRV